MTAAALGALLALAAPAAGKDEDRLQGPWQVVSIVASGKKVVPEQTGRLSMEVRGDRVTAREGDDVTAEYSFRLDPRARTIDLTVRKGDGGKVMHGLYRLDGERLTVCVAAPGKDRPKELAAPEGSGWTLMELRRGKP
jgi:uncharacterized protein (TIGR03067 family)